MQNMDVIAANEATALRGLSLDEAGMVGGGFGWGGPLHDVEHVAAEAGDAGAGGLIHTTGGDA